MLASKYRISKEEDFEKVKREGKIYQSENFGAAVLEKEEDEASRFGFVTSTKVSSLAVQRNRVKRALNEAVRQNLNIIGKGYEIVFLTKKSIAKKTTEEIMREVKTLILEKLKK